MACSWYSAMPRMLQHQGALNFREVHWINNSILSRGPKEPMHRLCDEDGMTCAKTYHTCNRGVSPCFSQHSALESGILSEPQERLIFPAAQDTPPYASHKASLCLAPAMGNLAAACSAYAPAAACSVRLDRFLSLDVGAPHLLPVAELKCPTCRRLTQLWPQVLEFSHLPRKGKGGQLMRHNHAVFWHRTVLHAV